ncbi:Acylglycerol kinase mitochondrial [Taenia crassiceps]|uniref:Acylglycerol kinase mitochondrial n=1 Tax=Taenia crassiceps TaxID=6207 RepID=A0ABR4QL09_9CEST
MEKLTGKDRLQRVTVFLNPFAHQRGILDKFDENAMPLLQISGQDVQMVYLDDDDEAKRYSSVLDPTSTDAIVVAGDDNLLAKVTSLEVALFCLRLLLDSYVGVIMCWCYRMIIPVLQNKSHRRNVLSIRPLVQGTAGCENAEDFELDSSKQEVFAMTGVEWSCWRDVEYGGGGLSLTAARPASHKPRLVTSPRCGGAGTRNSITGETSLNSTYEYYSLRQCLKRLGAACRHAFTYLRAPAFDLAPPTAEQLDAARRKGKPLRRGCAKQAILFVKPVCSGCKKCWSEKHRLAASKTMPETPRKSSWFGRLFGLSSCSAAKSGKRASETQGLGFPDYENPECGSETRVNVPPASRIVITLDEDNIRVNVSPAARSLVTYVRQALEHLTSPAYHCNSAESCALSFLCSSVILCPSRTDGEFFWIDNDSFEACPIEVSVLKDAVNSFPLADDFPTSIIPP